MGCCALNLIMAPELWHWWAMWTVEAKFLGLQRESRTIRGVQLETLLIIV